MSENIEELVKELANPGADDEYEQGYNDGQSDATHVISDCFLDILDDDEPTSKDAYVAYLEMRELCLKLSEAAE